MTIFREHHTAPTAFVIDTVHDTNQQVTGLCTPRAQDNDAVGAP